MNVVGLLFIMTKVSVAINKNADGCLDVVVQAHCAKRQEQIVHITENWTGHSVSVALPLVSLYRAMLFSSLESCLRNMISHRACYLV